MTSYVRVFKHSLFSAFRADSSKLKKLASAPTSERACGELASKGAGSDHVSKGAAASSASGSGDGGGRSEVEEGVGSVGHRPGGGRGLLGDALAAGHYFSEVFYIVTLYRKYTRKLTFENGWQSWIVQVSCSRSSHPCCNTLRGPSLSKLTLLRESAGRAEAVAGTFKAQEVANTLKAYVTMGREPGAVVFRELEGWAEALAGSFNAQEVVNAGRRQGFCVGVSTAPWSAHVEKQQVRRDCTLASASKCGCQLQEQKVQIFVLS